MWGDLIFWRVPEEFGLVCQRSQRFVLCRGPLSDFVLVLSASIDQNEMLPNGTSQGHEEQVLDLLLGPGSWESRESTSTLFADGRGEGGPNEDEFMATAGLPVSELPTLEQKWFEKRAIQATWRAGSSVD